MTVRLNFNRVKQKKNIKQKKKIFKHLDSKDSYSVFLKNNTMHHNQQPKEHLYKELLPI